MCKQFLIHALAEQAQPVPPDATAPTDQRLGAAAQLSIGQILSASNAASDNQLLKCLHESDLRH